jgi:hypothetical protein
LYNIDAYTKLKNKKMKKEKEDFTWLAKHFGIPVEDILWYNSGICYNRIGVTTRESAEKVSATVKGGTVNGGMLHEMPLGGISEMNKLSDNSHYFDVTC